MKLPAGKKGFTLIELLVVIAIIGLISSIVLASLSNAKARARDAQRISDIHQLANAISLFYNDNNYLPQNSIGWCTYISNPTNGYGTAFQSDLKPKYMKTVPLDPQLANQLGDYFYANLGNANGNFALCAVLEQNTGKNYTGTYGACTGWTNSYNYCITY